MCTSLLAPFGAYGQGMLNLKSDVPVQLSADDFRCDDKLGRCDVTGDVLLVSGSTVLSAKHLAIDFEKGEEGKRIVKGALATGDVLLVDGDVMTTCERIQLDPDLIQGSLGVAEIRVKKPGSVGALKGWDAYGAGRDIIYFSGRVKRTGQRSFHVTDVYFTPCDCGKDNRPIFSVAAKEADVEIGSGAVFYRPTLQPGDVALPFPFSLPAMYVPLSKRKSGLLPPLPRSLAGDGFYIDQKLYWAPTPDFDMTVGVGWNEKRGVRDQFEMRYSPTADLSGIMTGWHLHDVSVPAGQFGQERFTGLWDHQQGTWSRWSLKQHVEIQSDRGVMNAVAQSISALSTLYLPSRLAAEYRGDAWRASLGGSYYQDFSQSWTAFGDRSTRVVQRLPEAAVALAPIDLFGGVTLSFDSRFVANTAWAREAVQQYAPDTNCTGAAAIGVLGCERALRSVRLDAVPRLSRQFDVGGLKIRPEIFGLAAIGGTGIDPSPDPRGFVGATLEVSTYFGRIFNVSPNVAVRHRMRPIARYLFVPKVWGKPLVAMDERDQYIESHQATAGFETDLYVRPAGGSAMRVAYLSVTQGFNLGLLNNAAKAGLADLTGRVVLSWQPAMIEAAASFNPMVGYFRQYLLGAGVTGRGYYVRAAYEQIFERVENEQTVTGSQRINTGLFELVPGKAVAPSASGPLHNLSFSGSVSPGLGLHFDGSLQLSLPIAQAETATPDMTNIPTVRLVQAKVGAKWTGLCECFGVGVDVLFLADGRGGVQPPAIMPTLYIGDFAFKAQ